MPAKSSSVSTILPDGVVTTSTSVLASVCPAGSVGVCFQASPSVEPQTAAELLLALLSSQKRPPRSTDTRGSANPAEPGTRTVL